MSGRRSRCRLEFFYEQAPKVMRSCAMALQLLSSALGMYLSSALVYAVQQFTASDPWLPNDLNDGHLDLYFMLLAARAPSRPADRRLRACVFWSFVPPCKPDFEYTSTYLIDSQGGNTFQPTANHGSGTNLVLPVLEPEPGSLSILPRLPKLSTSACRCVRLSTTFGCQQSMGRGMGKRACVRARSRPPPCLIPSRKRGSVPPTMVADMNATRICVMTGTDAVQSDGARARVVALRGWAGTTWQPMIGCPLILTVAKGAMYFMESSHYNTCTRHFQSINTQPCVSFCEHPQSSHT